jgi:hypothetical protein
VRIEVSDGEPGLPVLYPVAPTTDERGIPLVRKVSRTWGVLPDEDGKTVWAELAVHS